MRRGEIWGEYDNGDVLSRLSSSSSTYVNQG